MTVEARYIPHYSLADTRLQFKIIRAFNFDKKILDN